MRPDPFVDLRRPTVQESLILRHNLSKATRDYFDSLNFLEIETPLLTRSDVTELCINEPGVAYLETREGWERVQAIVARYPLYEGLGSGLTP